MGGTVVASATGDPIADAWVLAIGATGDLRGTLTDEGGGFALADLPVGQYRAAVVDAVGGRSVEYWDDSADYAGATDFMVEAAATSTIDSALAAPTAPNVLDSAIGSWNAASGLLPNGDLPDLTGNGHDMALLEGYAPSYPPALIEPDPARGRHLFSPGWDDMYLDTPDGETPVTGVDVAWEGDGDQVVAVAAWKDLNWLVHQGSDINGSAAWGVGIRRSTGQVVVARSSDGQQVTLASSNEPFPAGQQRGAVTVDPASGVLTLYRQDFDRPLEDFDLPYSDPAWEVVDVVPGTGPVALHDSVAPIRHSAAHPRDRLGDSTAEGWFKSLYRMRVRDLPDGAAVAYLDVALLPLEPTWFTEPGLPPLTPGLPDASARSTSFPGRAQDTWTIHNYMTWSYPILVVDRPYVLFGNHSYGSLGPAAALGLEPGQEFSVWIAYSFPRVGAGGGPYVAVKDWSPAATTPGWALLTSPYFAGPSAMVSDGTAVAYDPSPAVSDSYLNVSGFQYDASADTVQSFANAATSGPPVSLGSLGDWFNSSAALTVAGYSDDVMSGPSFAFAGMAVFDRVLTPDEIERLPVEFGLP